MGESLGRQLMVLKDQHAELAASFIRLSEPISRGTVTGQRNSRTSLNDLNYP